MSKKVEEKPKDPFAAYQELVQKRSGKTEEAKA